MGAIKVFLLAIHILFSIGLIISVLLHSGKGGGLSGALGGGSGSMLSGSYIVEKNLDRLTILFAGGFAVTNLLLLWMLAPR